jgi:hypothetical protein
MAIVRKPGMGIKNAELMLISNLLTDLRKMPHKILSAEKKELPFS